MPRRLLRSAALAGLMTAVLATVVAADPYSDINAAAAANPITTHHVRGNVSMLDGSGGQITVLSGPEGVLMVDAGIAVSQQKIQAALRALNPGDIRFMILTHWHWDHADGDGWVRRSGAAIIANKVAVERLSQTIRVAEWGHTFTPVSNVDLPNDIITGDRTITFAGETVQIRHYRAGHTDGDISVYFDRADVLATGDTFWNGMYPFIDYVTGGSIDGAIDAANENLALAKPTTLMVPGHGPIGTHAQLVAFRDMLVAIRNNVATLKAQGLSVDQVVAARPTADYDARWGQSVISGELITRLVYRGV